MTKNLIRFAVRQEVETYNTRLVELEARLNDLQRQNMDLRRTASTEALMYLQQHSYPTKPHPTSQPLPPSQQ
ncbi:hypothetical protein SK128_006404, partial [Halocaridina rubra]